MSKILSRSLKTLALLVALALPALAEESNRGLYEGSLANGGKAVFFVQGNHAISAYFVDVSGHQASFAGGSITKDGTFNITTNQKSPVSGNVTSSSVTATFGGQQITANRVAIFGDTASIAGRFTGSATGGSNRFDVRIIVDSQHNIFFIGNNGATVIGAFGTINIQQTSTQPGGEDEDDDDDDKDQDNNEDSQAQRFTGTFTLTGLNGEAITGNLTFGHGTITGTITINGTTYNFTADRESSFNHLANISTRGFVNTGQGQLIGGFIITGGPKLVLVRALGPSLAAQGVNPALANPKLQLFQDSNGQQTLVKDNDDWQSNSNSSDIDKTTIAPKDGKESALLIRLEPGHYTTVVNGADNGTGIALVEVYEVDRD